MQNGLRTFIERTSGAETPDELFLILDDFIKLLGIHASSYRITAENLRSVPAETGLVHENFPSEWVEKYRQLDHENLDPIRIAARNAAKPFYWRDVSKKIKLTKAQKEFLKDLSDIGITDGIAVPIFGPMGAIAYFSFACIDGKLNFSNEEITELQLVCQQTHNRYSEITQNINTDEPQIKLSKRETEVLRLVSKGLSNVQIAGELSITENTVDTLLRRAFKKLGVNNRISAVVKAIGAGLILP